MPSTKDRQMKPLTSLPFPRITPQQILNTSFHAWYPTFRSLTPKARLIPLSAPFLAYLRADGIILPPEHKSSGPHDPEDSGYDDEGPDDDAAQDPSEQWPEIHAQITATIKDLSGKVVPKLNWSAPKDATWIATSNDMECRTPNDVYLLLKSSDFITHDLEHAFDGCTAVPEGDVAPQVPYHLVLRKAFNLNPALEFRCFVRNRKLIAISQREMNYFEFLFELRPRFKRLIQEFLDEKILGTGGDGFPDENFVMDVYVPPPHDKVWLVDFNPWAVRTDPLLFSWLELLTLEGPEVGEGSRVDADEGDDEDSGDQEDGGEEFVRLRMRPQSTSQVQQQQQIPLPGSMPTHESDLDSDSEEDDPLDTIFDPEFRLVNRDDPEAYQFTATKYSAHKLPRDVVDAGLTPGGMKDMMEEWKKVMDGKGREESESGSDEEVAVGAS